MKIAKSPTAVVAVGNSSSPKKDYNSSDHSLFIDKQQPVAMTKDSSLPSPLPAVPNKAIKDEMNPSSVVARDVSFGPSVEEVAAAAASITIADIENSDTNAVMAISPVPLFVMSPESPISPVQKIASPSFSPKQPPVILPPPAAIISAVQSCPKVTGALSSTVATTTHANNKESNIAHNKDSSHWNTKTLAITLPQTTARTTVCVPAGVNDVKIIPCPSEPIPKYTSTTSTAQPSTPIQNNNIQSLPQALPNASPCPLPNQSVTQHPQNKPISYSLQTIDKNGLMHNNDHITIKSTAITHTHHLPQDPKIYNKDTTGSNITRTPSLLQENNSISQSCSSTSSQDNIKTKPQHCFNHYTMTQSSFSPRLSPLKNQQQEIIHDSSPPKTATTATAIIMKPILSQCSTSTNDSVVKTNLESSSHINVSSIQQSKPRCTVTTKPPPHPPQITDNSNKTHVVKQSSLPFNPLMAQNRYHSINNAITVSGAKTYQSSLQTTENQTNKIPPRIPPVPPEYLVSITPPIKPLSEPNNFVSPKLTLKLPSPSVKPCTQQTIQTSNIPPFSQSKSSNSSSTNQASVLEPISLDQSNKLNSYPALNTRTNSYTESNSIPVVSSCGSSLQASPAVMSENPVGNIRPIPQHTPLISCDTSIILKKDTATNSKDTRNISPHHYINPKGVQMTFSNSKNQNRIQEGNSRIVIANNLGASTHNGLVKQSKSFNDLNCQKLVSVDMPVLRNAAQCPIGQRSPDATTTNHNMSQSLSKSDQFSSNQENNKNSLGFLSSVALNQKPNSQSQFIQNTTSFVSNISDENRGKHSQHDCKPVFKGHSYSTTSTGNQVGTYRTIISKNDNLSELPPIIQSRSEQSSASFANFESVGISYQNQISSMLDEYLVQRDSEHDKDQSGLIDHIEKRPCLLQQSRINDIWHDETEGENEEHYMERRTQISSHSHQLGGGSKPYQPVYETDHTPGSTSNDAFYCTNSMNSNHKVRSLFRGAAARVPNTNGPLIFAKIRTAGKCPLVSGTAAELLSRSKNKKDKALEDDIIQLDPTLDITPLVEGTAAAQVIATKKKTLFGKGSPQCYRSSIKWRSHGNRVIPLTDKSNVENTQSPVTDQNQLSHAHNFPIQKGSSKATRLGHNVNRSNVWGSHIKTPSLGEPMDVSKTSAMSNNRSTSTIQGQTPSYNCNVPSSIHPTDFFETSSSTKFANRSVSFRKYGPHAQSLPSISLSSTSIPTDPNLEKLPKSMGMNMLADIISHAPPIFSTSKQQKTPSIVKKENETTQKILGQNIDLKQQRYNQQEKNINQRHCLEHGQLYKYPPPPMQNTRHLQYQQNHTSVLQQTKGYQKHLSQQHHVQFEQGQQNIMKREHSNVQVKAEIAPVGQSPNVFSQIAAKGSMQYKLIDKVNVMSETSLNGITSMRNTEAVPCFTVGKIRRYKSALSEFGPWESLTCQSFEGSPGRRWCGLNIDECREILLRRSGRLRIFPNFLTESKRFALANGMAKFNGYRQYKKNLDRNNLYPDPRLHAMLSSRVEPNEAHHNETNTCNSEPGIQPLSLVPEVESLAKDVASIYRLPKEEWKIGVNLVVYQESCVGNGWHSNEAKGDSFSLCIVTESQGGPLPVLIRLNKNSNILEDGDEEIELWLNEGDAYEMDGCVDAGYEHCLPKQKADGMKRSLLFLRHGNTEQDLCDEDSLQDEHRQQKNKGGKIVSKSQTVHFGHPKRHIMEGKAFYSKDFLFETGAHMLDQRGLNGNLREGCDCLLLSKINFSVREEDGLCWLLYTTSRALGGGALCRSFHRKKPVRVFRSSHLQNNYAPQTKEEGRTAYRYDGLYSVRVMWDNEGNETNEYPPVGPLLHTFLLTRHPKRPFDGITEPGMYYNMTGVQELWNEIQKSQCIKFPRKFDIPQPPVILPSISKCKYHKGAVDSTVDPTISHSSNNMKSSMQFSNINGSSDHVTQRLTQSYFNTGRQNSDASTRSSVSGSEDESDSDTNCESRSDSDSDDCSDSGSEVESSDTHSVDTLNDKSVVSTESNLETSKEKEKSQVTDSDCSNGRPKRASATAARSYLQEVMQNRFGDVHEGEKARSQRTSVDSKKTILNLSKKGNSKDESSVNFESRVENFDSSNTSDNTKEKQQTLNNDIKCEHLLEHGEDLKIAKSGNDNVNQEVCCSQIDQVSLDVNSPPPPLTQKMKARPVTDTTKDQSSSEDLILESNNGNIEKKSDAGSESDGVDPTLLSIGTRVFVEYRDTLYKATIRKTRLKKGKYDFSIHYDGNKKSNIHWISATKIYEIIPDESATNKIGTPPKRSRKSSGQKNNSSSKHSKNSKDDSDESCVIINKYSKGNNAYVDYKHILYLATVRDMRISTKAYEYLVHYDGYKKTSDRWVQESQLHSITATSTRRFNKLRSEKVDNLSEELELSDEETPDTSKRKQELSKKSGLDMGDNNAGVAFLPGSCVFVEKQDALYLSKMLKRRRRGPETEYFVEYDCDCSEKTSESWVSLANVYEINPRTRRIFEKTSNKRKLNEIQEDSRTAKRSRGNRSPQQLMDMGDIPSGVVFLPGSTLFVLSEKGLHLAKMLKKRGRGNDMEYYIQYNGVKNNPDTWVPVSRVYEINPQTKRVYNKQQK